MIEMMVLQAGIPTDPASIFALVLTLAVGVLLYVTTRGGKQDGGDDAR